MNTISYLHRKNNFILIIFLCIILVGCVTGGNEGEESLNHGEEIDGSVLNPNEENDTELSVENLVNLNVLVVYQNSEIGYLTVVEQLKQTIQVGVSVDCVSIAKGDLEDLSFDKYDLLIVDSTINEVQDLDNTKTKTDFLERLNAFAKNGGYVVIENKVLESNLVLVIGDDIEVNKSTSYNSRPEVSFTESDNLGEAVNLTAYVTLLKDYYSISTEFESTMNEVDYGYSYLVPHNAISLMSTEDGTISSYHPMGDGGVLVLSGLLTNEQFNHRFDMQKDKEDDYGYQYTSSSAYRMMLDSLLKFVSLEKYGVSFSKIQGTHTRPSMTHQNHYEVYGAFEEDVMTWYSDLTKEYRQIPSYSMIRMPFNWFDWREMVGFHLNLGEGVYQGEWEESLYGSGVKLTTEGGYVELEKLPERISYYSKVDAAYKATPVVADMNQDGVLDVMSGSADGLLYYMEGVFLDATGAESEDAFDVRGEWMVKEPIMVKTMDSFPILVDGFSDPELWDFDADGDLDILVGSESGDVLFYEQVEALRFEYIGTLLSQGLFDYGSPTIYDIDQDGFKDLVVGTGEGELYVALGSDDFGSHRDRLDSQYFVEAYFTPYVQLLVENCGPVMGMETVGCMVSEDRHLSPEFFDVDEDGTEELVVGTNSGYLRQFELIYNDEWDGMVPNYDNSGHVIGETNYVPGVSAVFAEHVSMSTFNRDGNQYLWSGYNSSPDAVDLDGDGRMDLVLGLIEYGLGYSLDNPMSPLQDDLVAALAQAEEDYAEIYPHLYFHSYKSSEQERSEIERYMDVFESYGIPWTTGGTNHHTWRINTNTPWQSIENMADYGIWWNSGYWTIDQVDQPTYSNQWLWTMPFMYTGDEDATMLLYAPISRMAILEHQKDLVGRYEMPVSYFSHPDAEYFYDNNEAYVGQFAAFINEIRDQYIYNFNTEPQKSKNYMALLNTPIDVYAVEGKGYQVIRGELDSNIAALVGDYAETVGIKVEYTLKEDRPLLVSDSMIQFDHNFKLYVSLMDEGTMIYTDEASIASLDRSSIVSANMPVEIVKDGKHYSIQFKDKGLQEVMLPSVLDFDVLTNGFSVYDNGVTKTVYGYGDSDLLEIRMK